MRMLTLLLLLTLVPLLASESVLTYTVDGITAKSTLYTPKAEDMQHPGVLVIPEWWGCNAYAKRRASELAEAGYVAIAVDMYGEAQTTEDPAQAGAWAGPFYADASHFRLRARAALEQLAAQSGVDKTKLAAIGFCFGGSAVLELARDNAPLLGVVSFHGNLSTSAPAAAPIMPKILVLHGASDVTMPTEKVGAFLTEMMNAKADLQFISYPNAQHGFTNPANSAPSKLPVAYDAAAEKASMASMHTFLSALFNGK